MFQAFSRRKAAELVEHRRAAHLAAIYANSNYDPQKEGEEGPRFELTQSIEAAYDKVIFEIYNPGLLSKIEADETTRFKEDPFFKAMKVPKIEDIDYGDPEGQVAELRKRHEKAMDNSNAEFDQA